MVAVGRWWPVRVAFALLGLATLSTDQVTAQDVPPDSGPATSALWLSAGLGLGSGAGAGNGLSLAGAISYQKDRHRVTLRGSKMGDLMSGRDWAGEFGVLYGRTRVGESGYVAGLTGLSVVSVANCGGIGEGCSTVGLPLLIEGGVRSRSLGVGLQLFANWNRKASSAGVGMMVNLGRPRTNVVPERRD